MKGGVGTTTVIYIKRRAGVKMGTVTDWLIEHGWTSPSTHEHSIGYMGDEWGQQWQERIRKRIYALFDKTYMQRARAKTKSVVYAKSQRRSLLANEYCTIRTKTRYCVAKKTRIVTAFQADAIGGVHYRQNATIKEVTERFWWWNVATDVAYATLFGRAL